MSTRQILSDRDVSAVAELAVEPSYISEIARKLQAIGPPYSNMSFNVVIRLVSRSAFAMAEEGRLRVERPPLGGQVESSPKTSLVGEGFAETDEWKEYTVIQSDTDMSQVRQDFVEFIDQDILMSDKLEIVEFLSRQGNRMAQISEDILQDQVKVFDLDHIDESEYNQPGLDVYVEVGGFGYGIEISTRWVNPISGNYVRHKLDLVADKEAEREVPVDLLVMAPRFTGRERRNREGDEIITLSELPLNSTGSPIVISDFAQGGEGFGPDYPIVDEAFETFRNDLDNVGRDHNVIEESEYRKQITDTIRNFIGQ